MTLQQAKDETAKKYIARYSGVDMPVYYENWKQFEDNCKASIRAGVALTRLMTALDEAAELYAEANKNVSSNSSVSGQLRVAAQKLLDAVSKHHPQMFMDTQLDLYMAYHEVKDALSNDR